MSERLIQVSTLTEIADAIRDKKGTNAPILLTAFAEEISTIETGGGGGGMLTASTEEEMLALITKENIGQFIYYNGVTGTYVNGEYYKVVEDDTPDARYCQLYDLPYPATADDIAVGKQAYDEKGRVVNGTGVMSGEVNRMSYAYGKQDSIYTPYDIYPEDLGCISALRSYAFVYCSGLQNLSLPDTCKEIGSYAFQGCTNLKTLNTGGAEVAYNAAFSNCTSLSTLIMPNMKALSSYAFNSTRSMTLIEAPMVEDIGSNCFAYCGVLKSAIFPNVKTIGSYAFSQCSQLKEISISTVTSMSTGAFASCSNIESINLPLLSIIPSSAFQNCRGAKSISIPVAENILQYAFDGHTLPSFTIPSTCKKIESYALRGYVSCVYRVEALEPPTITRDTFYSTYVSRIEVSSGYLDVYKTASFWSTYSSKMVEY